MKTYVNTEYETHRRMDDIHSAFIVNWILFNAGTIQAFKVLHVPLVIGCQCIQPFQHFLYRISITVQLLQIEAGHFMFSGKAFCNENENLL